MHLKDLKSDSPDFIKMKLHNVSNVVFRSYGIKEVVSQKLVFLDIWNDPKTNTKTAVFASPVALYKLACGVRSSPYCVNVNKFPSS